MDIILPSDNDNDYTKSDLPPYARGNNNFFFYDRSAYGDLRAIWDERCRIPYNRFTRIW